MLKITEIPYIFLKLISYSLKKKIIQNNSTERKILVTGVRESTTKIH